MGIEIIRGGGVQGEFVVAAERIALTREGAVCPGDHGLAHELLVGEGGSIEAGEARKYGITPEGRLPEDWQERLSTAVRAARVRDKAVSPAEVEIPEGPAVEKKAGRRRGR